MKSFVIGAAFAALSALSAAAADPTVTGAYAFATPASGKAGAAYVNITGSDSADRLIGAASDIAKRVEIHEHQMTAGVMKMRRVEGGIDLPTGGTIEMAPGGYHVMLMGLNQQLEAGQMFPVTLTFESGAEVVVDVMVKERSEAGHSGHSGHSSTTN